MTAPKTERDFLKETLQRVIRTETRLMLLGSKLGHDLSDTDRVSVVPSSLSVYIGSLDVPLTSIIRACHKEGINANTVKVFHNAKLISEVYV